jgi:hypothetical protein
MPPSDSAACYRLYAAYCVEMAQNTLDCGHKAALLNMAQGWGTLADHIENRCVSDAVPVFEVPRDV